MAAHFTPREMRKFYTSWYMWAISCVTYVLVATGHPATLPQFDNAWTTFSFWWLGAAIYVLLSERYSVAVTRRWDKYLKRPIHLLVLSIPLVLFAIFAATALLLLLLEPHNSFGEVLTWQMILRLILIVHVWETITVLWIIPYQRAGKTAPKPAADQRQVILAGKSFPLEKIGRVAAAEHYLEVHIMHGNVHTIRERLGAFLDQVEPDDGIQTHRSHWVATSAIADVEGQSVKIHCGTIVPIARGRLRDVRTWWTGHKDEAAPPEFSRPEDVSSVH